MPHRILFKGREEYDIIDWYLQKQNKSKLNMITVNWLSYIKNVKKLRDQEPQQQARKYVKLQKQNIQIETDHRTLNTDAQSQSQSGIQNLNQSQNQNQNSSQNLDQQTSQSLRQSIRSSQEQSQSEKKAPKLKLSLRSQQFNKEGQQEADNKEQTSRNKSQKQNQQIEEEFRMQQDIQQSNDQQQQQLLNEVMQFLIDEMENSNVEEINQLQQQSEEYVKILPQFPKVVKVKQPIIILSQSQSKQEQLNKGMIILSQNQLKQLDYHIKEDQISGKRIMLQKQNLYSNTPLHVLKIEYPINLARQWWYFNEKEHVKYYLIHNQLVWYLSTITNQTMTQRIRDSIMELGNEYEQRCISLINNDMENNWNEDLESSIIRAAELAMKDQIKNNYDKNESNYSFEHIENAWFTNSTVNQIYIEHKTYNQRKTLVNYVKINEKCYYTNMLTKDLIRQMINHGITLQSLPIFETKYMKLYAGYVEKLIQHGNPFMPKNALKVRRYKQF